MSVDKNYCKFSHCLNTEQKGTEATNGMMLLLTSTVIRTFIVSNMIKTTKCDKSLTP